MSMVPYKRQYFRFATPKKQIAVAKYGVPLSIHQMLQCQIISNNDSCCQNSVLDMQLVAELTVIATVRYTV